MRPLTVNAFLFISLAIIALSRADDDNDVPQVLVVATYGVWPFVNGTDAGTGEYNTNSRILLLLLFCFALLIHAI